MEPRYTDDMGRTRIVRNLASSWLAQLVLMAIGFVMPRVIDFHIGQRMLGIWDFGWSIVSYLSLTSLGVGSSVNRYVARFRATREKEQLDGYVASVVCIQLCVAAAILAGTGLLVPVLSVLFADRLGDDAGTAAWVVGLLGGSLAVTMVFDPARGILTGAHHWDIHNGLNVGSRLVAAAGMIAVLTAGYGLIGMSVCYFVATVLAEVTRFLVARRVCPDITVDLRRARWRYAREMIRFGTKSVVVALPRILVVQTTSVMLMNAVGPAAVAVLSRPLHLADHVAQFVSRFAFLLTPTAGAIQGLGRERELRDLMLQSTTFTVAISLPLTLVLVIHGDWILRIWMGEDYVNHAAIAILSVGLFLATAQSPSLSVITGMNMHGRIGIATLAIAALVTAAGYAIAHVVGWSIVMAATVIGAGVSIAHGIALPWFACRKLDVSYVEYLRIAFERPAAICVAFAAILLAGRAASGDYGLASVLLSCAAGTAVLAAAYWRFLIPAGVKAQIMRRVGLVDRA